MVSAHALQGVPTQLWRLVSLARHRLLMLDFDGTLAPFVVDRDQAWPHPRALEWLRRIAEKGETSVVIVSGRPLADLERLVGDVPVTLYGEHGWEQRAPDGSVVRPPLDRVVAAAIDEAERLARSLGAGDRLERKRSGLVLHTRGLSNTDAHALEHRCADAWQGLARLGLLRLDHINGGLEIRAKQRDKGTVVLSLVSHAEPGTLAVFVGDDVTDEDAFEVVRDYGFGVRVGNDDRPSSAMARIASSEEVADWLGRWWKVTAGS
jgi:trehalose 6-phosphate phosphatase